MKTERTPGTHHHGAAHRAPQLARRTIRLTMGLSLLVAAILTAGVASAEIHGRDYDARFDPTKSQLVAAEPTESQKAAIAAWTAGDVDLAVEFDELTGVTHSIRHHTGFLTKATPAFEAKALAMSYANEMRDVLGLTARDLEEFELSDNVYSKVSGVTHVYFRQTHRGIPVYNGLLHVNIDRDGRIVSLNNAFIPNLKQTVAGIAAPVIDPAASLRAAAQHLGLPTTQKISRLEAAGDKLHSTRLEAPEMSLREVETRLFWLPVGQGDTRLVWNFDVFTLDDAHVFNFNVDAVTGQIWTRSDYVDDASYRVFAIPDESPLHGSQGRVLVVNPEDSTASPNGWLDDPNGILQGNNVYACLDRDASSQDIPGNPTPQPSGCDGGDPTCAAGVCDFPIDLGAQPVVSADAALANLFYWSNLIHDIQYVYGFDEPAGNFQTNNFGNGGQGGDAVRAEGQDGDALNSPARNCNANFFTFPDGDPPRMQMYTCTNANPKRDGDYDNGVILHEYGHGISNRQVGGPSLAGCLGNTQQAGEGWSDLIGLMYTVEPGDAGTDARGIGSYLFNRTPEGGGIRDLPYSTDNAVNNWTYESISGAAVPHGVGSRWAQVMWEVYWALVAEHGIEHDLENFNINDANEAGNKRAMFYVNEGLKNTSCSPTFVDGRDGVIAAATASFGGEDVCLLWQTFAAFGLGTNAVSGGANSTNPTNGFQIPAACQCSPQAIANAGPDQTINEGDPVQIGTAALSNHTYSWSPGGATTAQVTVSPTVTTTYTVTASTSCGNAQDSVTVTVLPAGAQIAVYNAGLGAPACLGTGSSCDSTDLVDGRGAGLGPEPNQPNTLDGCADGGTGTYHSDESNDRIVVSTLDGSDFTEGATVRVDATVWAWNDGSQDTLDLYYAADANSPSWTLIQSIPAGGGSERTLSATYTLPSGSLQAVRARFRYQGSAAPCNNGNYDDADDLVFAVSSASGCSVNADCDDGSFCNGAETCNAGVCQAGTAVSCDDGVSCTVDACNELSDSCDNTADDSLCDNGLFCDGTETCDAVNDCQAGSDPCSGGETCNESSDICEGGGGTPVTVTFTSIAAEDGWTRESNENSNVGGAANATGSGSRPIRPGDGTQDRQYKSILSFDTSSIPPGATIQSATLRLQRGTVRGSNPFTSGFGQCQVDVMSGGFSGSTALQASDFEAAATATAVAVMSAPAANGDWSEGTFDTAGLAAINTSGTTQARVYFTVDDNDDGGDDHMGYYSGDNSVSSRHPQLVVTYVE